MNVTKKYFYLNHMKDLVTSCRFKTIEWGKSYDILFEIQVFLTAFSNKEYDSFDLHFLGEDILFYSSYLFRLHNGEVYNVPIRFKLFYSGNYENWKMLTNDFFL